MRRQSACLLRAVLLASICLPGCSASDPSQTYSDFPPVGDFSLIERSGREVNRSELAGKVWVASFIFTRCGGPCPLVSEQMALLQHDLEGERGFLLVSFTVDPQHDTPEVLQDYAKSYQADPDRWLFLTGPRDQIYTLIGDSFHLPVKENEGKERTAGFEVLHSTRLVLVDDQGRIRGYFKGTTPDDLPNLEREIKVLSRQRLEHELKMLGWPGRLPEVNAALNATSAFLVALGYLAIRRRWVLLHKSCMLTALGVSALFLASYLYYHGVVRHGQHTPFPEEGPIRWVYLGVLTSHTILAVVAAPLVLFTAYQGLRGHLARHVRIARWILPVWMYVSITGVVVYWMLYQLYPSG